MEVLNRAAIKAEAKNFIGQDRRWLTMALACLPLVLLQGAISGGITVVNRLTQDGETYTEYSAGSNVIAWLLIPFTVAMAGYFLNYLRGFNPEWKSLYREGLDRYGKYFSVGLVTQIVIGLWSLLLIVPGIVKAYEYYFVHQIIHDNPNLSQKQARELSSRMTNGYKGDLFVLDLSFFLWYMLVAITCGLAMFYVGPYIMCTNAMYYENLKNSAIATGKAAPEEFGIFPVPPVDNAAPYNANSYNANPYASAPQQTYAPTYGTPQQPFAQAPYAAPQPPFAGENAPVAPNTGSAEFAEPSFTPPAPESTFVPGDEAVNNEADSEKADTENQDF